MTRNHANAKPRLPIHGFVLGGGQSSRMGRDKTTLEFRGKPMVEIAVEKLRSFCEEVSISGNREDLRRFAAVVPEDRHEVGPLAGMEAGLKSAERPWAMFIPVDVPLVPTGLLRAWAAEILNRGQGLDGFDATAPVLGTCLATQQVRQPAFCLLRSELLSLLTGELDQGERRINAVLRAVVREYGESAFQICEASRYAGKNASQIERWFHNINTPDELAEAEMWLQSSPDGECHTD